jgi:hypothetical protein
LKGRKGKGKMTDMTCLISGLIRKRAMIPAPDERRCLVKEYDRAAEASSWLLAILSPVP